jgi:transcriptional regulator with XRE-family HTH domain
MRTTGDWIKHYRHTAKMTQIELARAIHKTQATISRWESGQDAILLTDVEMLLALFRQRGIEPTPPPRLTMPAANDVRVHGFVGDGGVIAADPDRVEYVAPPESFLHLSLAAYRVATDTLPVLARGTLLFAASEVNEPDAVSPALSVVTTPERGTLLGFPRLGGRGRYFIERLCGRVIDTPITTAAPILLILPKI